jgi:hypothetical protein
LRPRKNIQQTFGKNNAPLQHRPHKGIPRPRIYLITIVYVTG